MTVTGVSPFTQSSPSNIRPRFARNDRRRASVLAALTLGSTLSIGCVQVNADVPEVEVTRQNLEFQAIPQQLPEGAEFTVRHEFSYEESPVDLPDSITTDMRATEVTVTARDGIADLSFIRLLTLTVKKSGASPITVIDYVRPQNTQVGNSVTVPVEGSGDVLNPWAAQDSTLELAATGLMPRHAWSVDVTVKFTGSFTYKL